MFFILYNRCNFIFIVVTYIIKKRNRMKLAHNEAMRCIELLDKLDVFAIRTLNIFQPNEIIQLTDINMARKTIRNRWLQEPTFLETFITKHSKELSNNDKILIRSWNNYVTSCFLIVRYDQEYAVFLSLYDQKLYAVHALTDSFETMIQQTITDVMIETVLLPYHNQIMWDGLVGIVPIPETIREETQALTKTYELESIITEL
jgi:hypothetical protein